VLTKILAYLSLITIFLAGLAAADNRQPVPVDLDTLPQMEITSEFGQGVVQFSQSKSMIIYGTVQDKYNDFMIWYLSQNGPMCFMGKADQQLWRITDTQECFDLYNLGLSNGDYDK